MTKEKKLFEKIEGVLLNLRFYGDISPEDQTILEEVAEELKKKELKVESPEYDAWGNYVGSPA